jgi:hypothetical protein
MCHHEACSLSVGYLRVLDHLPATLSHHSARAPCCRSVSVNRLRIGLACHDAMGGARWARRSGYGERHHLLNSLELVEALSQQLLAGPAIACFGGSARPATSPFCSRMLLVEHRLGGRARDHFASGAAGRCRGWPGQATALVITPAARMSSEYGHSAAVHMKPRMRGKLPRSSSLLVSMARSPST